MPIPFYLINGFLGSGKTTLLKRILQKQADDKKIGVIQNEFAALNIDAGELRRLGKSFKILEVNRGSVFCVCLLSDFIASLRDFIEAYQPDVLYLEASGLSDPIAILQLLSAPELKNRIYLTSIFTIVDAATFLNMEKSATSLSHQIRVADRVVVNKTDLADENIIVQITNRIMQINPLAKITTASYCDIPLDHFADMANPVVTQQAEEFSNIKPHTRPPVGTAVVKSTKKISREALDVFLREQAPKSWRLKGHVQLSNNSAVMVQSVFDKSNIVPMPDYNGPTELIAIGPEVDAKKFSRRFRELV